MARNPKSKNILGGGGRGSRPQLEGEALARYNELKEELKLYQDRKRDASNRLEKTKTILDNFERVITEDVIADASGYNFTEGEIDNIVDNSIIISKTDIAFKINTNIYSTLTRSKLTKLNNDLFKSPKLKSITKVVDELGDDEAYSQFLIQFLKSFPGLTNIFKNKYIDIIEELEDDLS